MHQVEKRLQTSVTEEGTNGEVRVVEEVVSRGVSGGAEEEEVRLEVAVTSREVLGGEGSKKRLGGLGWGLLVLTLGILSGSAFVFVRRRRGRSRGGGGRRGSSSGVPSCSASTVKILKIHVKEDLNVVPQLDGEEDRYSCYDDVFLTTLEEDIII